MATEKVINHDTAPAGADLSSKIYTLVKLNSSGQLVSAAAGDNAFALLDNPTQGHWGTYATVGRAKAVAGGTIAPGAYLASDASGHLLTATTGQHIVGIALSAGVSGDVVPFTIGTGTA